jgi:hypothetical protein
VSLRYLGLSYLSLILTGLSGDTYRCNQQGSTRFYLRKSFGAEELFTYLPVRGDGLSLFDDGDITWDDLAGRNLLLFPLANDLVHVEVSTKE